MPSGRLFVYMHEVMEHNDPGGGWENAPRTQKCDWPVMSMSSSRQWE